MPISAVDSSWYLTLSILSRGRWDDHIDIHCVGFELREVQVCANLYVHKFFPFNYNSWLWEYMPLCISQHNFMPDLDIDLEVILYSLGNNILSIIPYFYHQKHFSLIQSNHWYYLPILSLPSVNKTEQNRGKQCSDSSLAPLKSLDWVISLNCSVIKWQYLLCHIIYRDSAENFSWNCNHYRYTV